MRPDRSLQGERLMLDYEIQSRIGAVERQRRRRGGALNARDRPEPLEQRIEERDCPSVLAIPRGRQRNARDRQLGWLESGRHVDETVEAQEKERRAGEKDQRQRQLGDDERGTDPPRPR